MAWPRAAEGHGLQAEGDGILCSTAPTTLGNTGRVFPILKSENHKQYYLRFVILSYTVPGVLKARTLKWFAIPFSNRPVFVRTPHHEPSLGGPTCGMAHSFIELDKAVVHVISLISFL